MWCRRLHLPLGAGLPWLFAVLIGCNPLAPSEPPSQQGNGDGSRVEKAGSVLRPSVTEIDLGVVARAGQKNAMFTLTNNGPNEIEVSRIKASCDCLTVRLSSRSIRPSETVEAKAMLDLRVEPDFTGKLAIDVEGFAVSGQRLFAVLVLVSVPHQNMAP